MKHSTSYGLLNNASLGVSSLLDHNVGAGPNRGTVSILVYTCTYKDT